MRIDKFVAHHLDYLSGKIKLANAKYKPQQVETGKDLRNSSNEKCGGTKNEGLVGASTGNSDCILLFATSHVNVNDAVPDNSMPILQCPACQIDGEPSGSHHCIKCRKVVHNLDQCSMPYGEEGYAQDRICLTCLRNDEYDKEVLALREPDNWRNKHYQNEEVDKKRKRQLDEKIIKKQRAVLYLG